MLIMKTFAVEAVEMVVAIPEVAPPGTRPYGRLSNLTAWYVFREGISWL